MSWMVAFGRLILPDGLSRCDRDWFAVTRYAGMQRRCILEVSDGDASLATHSPSRPLRVVYPARLAVQAQASPQYRMA
jgi:hypothetical protein